MSIILYIVFFGLWLLNNYKKYKFNISSFLISLYLIGPILCEIMMIIYPDYVKYPERITLASVSFHILLLWLLMSPVIRFGNKISIHNFRTTYKTLNIVCWFIVICSLSSILISFTAVVHIFAFGNFHAARMAYMAGELDTSGNVVKYGFIGYFINIGPLVSFIATFLFFYLKFVLRKNGILCLLLFISSFTMIFSNLALAGREGFLRFILFFAANFFLFKKYIDLKKHKKAILVFFGIFFLCGIVFTQISKDRFNDSREGTAFSYLRYGGEQFYLFSYDYQRFQDCGYSQFKNLFPIFFPNTPKAHHLNRLLYADYSLNTFSTIAGSLVKRVGRFDALLFCILFYITFSIVFRTSYKNTHYIGLTKMIGFLFLFEVVLMGFFYYMHYTHVIQLYMLLVTLFAYIISNFYKNRSTQIKKYENIVHS